MAISASAHASLSKSPSSSRSLETINGNGGMEMRLAGQPHGQRFQPLHGVVAVVLDRFAQQAKNLRFAFVAITS